MKLHSKPLVAAAVGLALLLTSCGGPEQDNDGEGQTASVEPAINAQPYENVKDGGTLTSAYSFSGDDTQGMPWNVNASLTATRLWFWYNPVAITYSATGDVEINPDYYTEAKAETVDGKQVLSITLNPEATFNDGTPIDWRTIEATWKANNGEDEAFTVASPSGFDQIEKVERGVDDKQAVVTFSSPYTAWPRLFARPIHPEAATPENFNNAYSNKVQPQWGAGPFTVESYDPNTKRLVFKRNDKWWGKPGKLDKRVFLDIGSEQATANAFRAGETDYTTATTAEIENQVSQTTDAERRSAVGPFQYSLFLNTESELLKDVNVRKAILQSVDRPQLARIQFQGMDFSEPLPGSTIAYSYQDHYQDNVGKVLTPGTDEAKQTLDDAGWKQEGEGTRTKDGKTLSVDFVLDDDSPTAKAMAQSLTADMKKAGIALNLKTISPAQSSSTINEGKFDLIIGGNRSIHPFGAFNLPRFFGSAPGNITRATSDQIDKDIASVLEMSDPDAQVERANEVEREGLQFFNMLPIYTGPSTIYAKKDLANQGSGIFATPLPETIGWQKDS